ncbi:MAG: transglycosylase [Hyphomicrobium sp.]
MGALGTFLLLVVFGAGVGIAMTRYGHSWLGRHVAGATGAGEITYALVGVAGSFMGYHIAGILGIGSELVAYILAIGGAALTIWLWRRT